MLCLTSIDINFVVLYLMKRFRLLLTNQIACECESFNFIVRSGEELDLSIPFHVMGGVSFVGVYVTLRLPETSKSLLPNTVEEALALERKK